MQAQHKEAISIALVEQAVQALQANNIGVTVVGTGAEAKAKVLAMLPEGADVAMGTSATLRQTGVVQALEEGPYHFWHKDFLAESDADKRAQIRRRATLADYFVGSVNAISATGQLVAADFSGSRVGAYLFGAGKLILVASANKIVPDLAAAMDRVRNVALPQEDQRMKSLGAPGSRVAKWAIIEFELRKDRIHLVLVRDEELGF